MIKTFTQHDLIRYAYDELETETKKQLEAAMRHDQELAEACSDMLLGQEAINLTLHKPSEKSVAAILNYSKSVSLQH